MNIVKDTIQIGKIVMAVSLMFNFNSLQESELKNYVKLREIEWVSKRKTEQEVEEMIKAEARNISQKW